jgi:hypothetical protein
MKYIDKLAPTNLPNLCRATEEMDMPGFEASYKIRNLSSTEWRLRRLGLVKTLIEES